MPQAAKLFEVGTNDFVDSMYSAKNKNSLDH